MPAIGRGGHIQHSIHDFVVLPVVWQCGVLLIVPLALGWSWNMVGWYSNIDVFGNHNHCFLFSQLEDDVLSCLHHNTKQMLPQTGYPQVIPTYIFSCLEITF